MQPSLLPGPGIPGLVSVIIPTYNRASIIRDTIDSVLAQTYQEYEVIVVDDGSVDDTRDMVASYTDSRIVYFYKDNGGLSSARNAGLDRARGEYIAFLDSDDVWRPWKLAAQVEIFRRHPDVGMIWTDMAAFDETGLVLAERYLRAYYGAYSRVDLEHACVRAGALRDLAVGAPPELGGSPYHVGNVFREMFLGNLVHPPTAIVRRQRLREAGNFEHEVTRGGAEDYHFYLRVAERGAVAFLDAPSILYRVHSGSMTKNNSIREAHGDLRVLTHWQDKMSASLPRAIVRNRLAGAYRWVGVAELYGGNPRGATAYLWRSLRLKPSQPFLAALLMVSLFPHGAVQRIRAIKRAARPLTSPGMLLRIGALLTGGLFVAYRLAAALQPELSE